LGAHLEISKALDDVAVGAFVFDDADRLLLVQRAAHDSWPLCWEIPGGAVDVEDESLLHGVARELWEEAGLRARRVGELVGDGTIFATTRGLRVCSYAFFVEVEDYDVKLDPNEHQAFLWVTEDEARAKKCGDVHMVYTTKDRENGIMEAFRMRREKGKA
jgi:8-oxo-dGTP pyrophosphatase MutT (NUDIX family)